MLFSTSIFLFTFLPITLGIYYLILFNSKTRENRQLLNLVLLVASLFFYAWGEPLFISIMLLSITVNWKLGLLISMSTEEKHKKRLLTIMLTFNIMILFIFKYLTFTLHSLNNFVDFPFTVPNILLPIGISFFTFQAISYVVDVYRGHGKAQENPLNVGLYIAFFPQLIAGPIVRYETVANQLLFRKETPTKFNEGVSRFIIGLSKKIVIANSVALAADRAFDLPASEMSVASAWIGALAYTIQIYFDFSGYSDMAIGLGKMFGFDFLENFNYPYISQSISEFWRRWHISLGTWFKDYVYFPLGGSRVPIRRLYLNLFVVWLLTGIWHGANWTFLVWGLLYFILIAFEKISNFEKMDIPSLLRWSYTMIFVVLGWIIFRSESLFDAGVYIKQLVPFIGNELANDSTKMIFFESSDGFLLGILFSTPYLSNIFKKFSITYLNMSYMKNIGHIFLIIICIIYIVNGGYNPFIYFNF
jgi:alginate O-acetyltransferase complex protein AlgI